MAVLQWEITADGISMVEPAGNSITSPHSQRTRWPPRLGSNDPKAVIAHRPNGRFAVSLCLKHSVRGPKLTVADANTLDR